MLKSMKSVVKKSIGKSFISFLRKIKLDEIVSKVDRKNIYKQHLIEKYKKG